MKYLRIALFSLPVIAILAYFGYQRYPVNPPIKISSSAYGGELSINKLKLPEGFHIDVFAEGVENARSMCLSPNGTLFVGTRSKGNVYALVDSDQDGRSDKMHILLTKGNMPNGVAFKDGDLYVAEVNRILKFTDIESRLADPGEPEVVYENYPTEGHHGWKYIAFGPDERLYVPVGAPCNICDSEDDIFATITSIKADGTDMRIEHEGIRNTVGFDWDPISNELWFTDNGRDWMGDEEPECELNHATGQKQHFGYPFCHQGNLLDPDFGKDKNCNDFIPPVVNLGPHTAPLGMEFYEGQNFPKEFANNIFVARHGSWNRKEKIGYDVMRVSKTENGAFQLDSFISGWLSEDKTDVWGRPVDIEIMPDGSMLISDDYADAIYRVFYKPS